MTLHRFALIVAVGSYDNVMLKSLPSTAQDAIDLSSVLGDPEIGDFEIQILSNEPSHKIIEAAENFVSDREPDDLILMHFSCHGLKDKDGRLYLAGTNTRPDRLIGTALPATQINDLLLNSRSRQRVLMLDCCYGGAFLRGVIPRAADKRVGVLERFPEGRGMVVFTASDALQYA